MKKFLFSTFLIFVGLVLAVVLFFTIRQMLANVQIERESQVVPTSAPVLEATSRLVILPLYEEDRASQDLDFGHGVSYLIRTDSSTILMDLGNNPDEAPQLPALENMKELEIAWEAIDAIVISHPHPDHIGGVKAWQEHTLSFGDFTGDVSRIPIYVPTSLADPKGNLILSSEPTLVRDDIATTGVISYPEVFPISLFTPKGFEQGLVIHVRGQGLVMITGCGHPTMEKLVSRAEALYGEPVVGVVGGLHYEKLSTEEAQPHIQFLLPYQPKLVALSPHDSSPEALEAFRSAFPDSYAMIRVGEAIQFP